MLLSFFIYSVKLQFALPNDSNGHFQGDDIPASKLKECCNNFEKKIRTITNSDDEKIVRDEIHCAIKNHTEERFKEVFGFSLTSHLFDKFFQELKNHHDKLGMISDEQFEIWAVNTITNCEVLLVRFFFPLYHDMEFGDILTYENLRLFSVFEEKWFEEMLIREFLNTKCIFDFNKMSQYLTDKILTFELLSDPYFTEEAKYKENYFGWNSFVKFYKKYEPVIFKGNIFLKKITLNDNDPILKTLAIYLLRKSIKHTKSFKFLCLPGDRGIFRNYPRVRAKISAQIQCFCDEFLNLKLCFFKHHRIVETLYKRANRSEQNTILNILNYIDIVKSMVLCDEKVFNTFIQFITKRFLKNILIDFHEYLLKPKKLFLDSSFIVKKNMEIRKNELKIIEISENTKKQFLLSKSTLSQITENDISQNSFTLSDLIAIFTIKISNPEIQFKKPGFLLAFLESIDQKTHKISLQVNIGGQKYVFYVALAILSQFKFDQKVDVILGEKDLIKSDRKWISDMLEVFKIKCMFLPQDPRDIHKNLEYKKLITFGTVSQFREYFLQSTSLNEPSPQRACIIDEFSNFLCKDLTDYTLIQAYSQLCSQANSFFIKMWKTLRIFLPDLYYDNEHGMLLLHPLYHRNNGRLFSFIRITAEERGGVVHYFLRFSGSKKEEELKKIDFKELKKIVEQRLKIKNLISSLISGNEPLVINEEASDGYFSSEYSQAPGDDNSSIQSPEVDSQAMDILESENYKWEKIHADMFKIFSEMTTSLQEKIKSELQFYFDCAIHSFLLVENQHYTFSDHKIKITNFDCYSTLKFDLIVAFLKLKHTGMFSYPIFGGYIFSNEDLMAQYSKIIGISQPILTSKTCENLCVNFKLRCYTESSRTYPQINDFGVILEKTRLEWLRKIFTSNSAISSLKRTCFVFMEKSEDIRALRHVYKKEFEIANIFYDVENIHNEFEIDPNPILLVTTSNYKTFLNSEQFFEQFSDKSKGIHMCFAFVPNTAMVISEIVQDFCKFTEDLTTQAVLFSKSNQELSPIEGQTLASLVEMKQELNIMKMKRENVSRKMELSRD